MKYRDKDGNVFEDIGEIHSRYCVGRDCNWGLCNLASHEYGCIKWVGDNPAEAARLMGYEVVEDKCLESDAIKVVEIDQVRREDAKVKCYREGGCGPYEYRACNECPASKPEYAANMDKQKPVAENTAMKEATALETQGFSVAEKQKPRICEVLGVEVGERFAVDGFPGTKAMWIGAAGTYFTDPGQAKNSSYAMMYAIQHPESIIRQPRFTEEEVEDAKAIMRLIPSARQSISRNTDGTLVIDNGDGWEAFMARNLFPSIRPGQSVELSEIINETK